MQCIWGRKETTEVGTDSHNTLEGHSSCSETDSVLIGPLPLPALFRPVLAWLCLVKRTGMGTHGLKCLKVENEGALIHTHGSDA